MIGRVAIQCPIYCLSCNYLLNGLQTEACPECGRPFRFRDPGSYWTAQRDTREGALRGLARLALLLSGLANMLFALPVMAIDRGTGLLWGLILIVLGIVAVNRSLK